MQMTWTVEAEMEYILHMASHANDQKNNVKEEKNHQVIYSDCFVTYRKGIRQIYGDKFRD